MYFIMEGVVRVIIGNEKNKNKIDILLKKGEYFGEIALLVNSKRTASI